MKAMIFAAGLGTRLRPLTDTMPKALVEIDGIPMIDRVIGLLRHVGVERIVVNVHHHADLLIRYLRRYDDVAISDERECLLDTGGGVLAARSLLDGTEPIILYNADILTDVSLSRMVDAHISGGAQVTLLVDHNRISSRKLLFGSSGLMCGWRNDLTGEVRPAGLADRELSEGAFGGIHVVSPDIFSALESYSVRKGRVFSITPFYIEECGRIPIMGYVPDVPYQWFDIGTMEKLECARLNYR